MLRTACCLPLLIPENLGEKNKTYSGKSLAMIQPLQHFPCWFDYLPSLLRLWSHQVEDSLLQKHLTANRTENAFRWYSRVKKGASMTATGKTFGNLFEQEINRSLVIKPGNTVHSVTLHLWVFIYFSQHLTLKTTHSNCSSTRLHY